MAHVQLNNITKRYDHLIAINNLSLEVKDREFVVFLGPSGCGKTTTLRSVAGLEHPEEGDILIDGKRVNNLSPADRDIAMVFQFYALYPHLSVYDNMAFPLRAVKMAKSDLDQRVREVAKVLHVEHLLARRPGKLSGGEMQRVAIGRAMVRRPKLFLMDEPLTNLDAKLRAEMRAELKRLQNDIGATTVYVTHDQLEAMSMGDRIAVMNQGVLQQMGTPGEVYDHPRNLFVAGFIGSPAMNFLPCRLSTDQSVLELLDSSTRLTASSATQSGAPQPAADDRRPEAAVALPLTPATRQRLAAHRVTGDLVLGVRAEDVALSREEKPEFLAAEVYVVEPLGSENIIDLRLAGHVFKARTAPTFTARIGEPMWARIDQDRMHLFDSATSEALF
jgi:multiple sugar transport system ATP-binding protein